MSAFGADFGMRPLTRFGIPRFTLVFLRSPLSPSKFVSASLIFFSAVSFDDNIREFSLKFGRKMVLGLANLFK
jgi:hypothetical protein